MQPPRPINWQIGEFHPWSILSELSARPLQKFGWVPGRASFTFGAGKFYLLRRRVRLRRRQFRSNQGTEYSLRYTQRVLSVWQPNSSHTMKLSAKLDARCEIRFPEPCHPSLILAPRSSPEQGNLALEGSTSRQRRCERGRTEEKEKFRNRAVTKQETWTHGSR